MKFILLILISFLGLQSCTQNTNKEENITPPTEAITAESKAVLDKPTENSTTEIDDLIKEIEEKVTVMEGVETEKIIDEVNVCAIKDFEGIKKTIFCFDGGMKAQECTIYYQEGKAIVGLVNLEFYNASPANIGAFDESKTVKNRMKIYFEEGSLSSFDKIESLSGETLETDGSLEQYWDILARAAE